MVEKWPKIIFGHYPGVEPVWDPGLTPFPVGVCLLWAGAPAGAFLPRSRIQGLPARAVFSTTKTELFYLSPLHFFFGSCGLDSEGGRPGLGIV